METLQGFSSSPKMGGVNFPAPSWNYFLRTKQFSKKPKVNFIMSTKHTFLTAVSISALLAMSPVMTANAAQVETGQSLAQTWAILNNVCRGSSPTNELVCAERERLGAKLDRIKGCVYGNHGEYDPEHDEYTCEPSGLAQGAAFEKPVPGPISITCVGTLENNDEVNWPKYIFSETVCKLNSSQAAAVAQVCGNGSCVVKGTSSYLIDEYVEMATLVSIRATKGK